MKRTYVLVVIIGIILTGVGLVQLGTRSGVTSEEVRETLPGDEVIRDPWITIDRAATLPSSSETAWPWVQQLGKDRAGWYAPRWLENTLRLHSADTVVPEYQHLAVGDVVPDWGGGTLKVLSIDPDHSIVYGSLHPVSGVSDTTRTDYQFTWALVLEESTPTSTRFHLRLRMKRPDTGILRFVSPAPLGLIDWATDAVMFMGIKEKVQH